jgi:hypothetical protein
MATVIISRLTTSFSTMARSFNSSDSNERRFGPAIVFRPLEKIGVAPDSLTSRGVFTGER